MPIIKLSVPSNKAAAIGSPVSTRLKKLISEAMAQSANPEPFEKKDMMRFSLNLSDTEYTAWLTYSGRKQFEYEYFVGLLYAKQTTVTPVINVPVEVGGRFLRPEQVCLAESCFRAIQKNKILLAEAATGTGKSLIIAHVASETVKKTDQPVIVASPTIDNIRHLVGEYQSLNTSVPFRIVFGQGEYVSSFLLSKNMQSITSDPSIRKRIHQWMLADAPPIENTPFPNLRWNMHSLSIITGHDPKDLAEIVSVSTLVSTSPEAGLEIKKEEILKRDHGLSCYHQTMAEIKNMEASKEAPCVTFVTHTMLAIDLKYRVATAKKRSRAVGEYLTELREQVDNAASIVGIFGEFEKHFIIDEAHLFEQILSDNIHLQLSLGTTAKILRRTFPSGYRLAKPAIGFLNGMFGDGEFPIHGQRMIEAASEILTVLKDQSLSPDETDADNNKNWLQREIDKTVLKYQMRIFKEALIPTHGATKGNPYGPRSGKIVYTEGRTSAVIQCHEAFADNHLSSLYGMAISCVFVSATLNVPGMGYQYFSEVLCVPPDRLVSAKPIEPTWLKHGVSMYLPDNNLAENLSRPPSKKGQYDPMLETAWIHGMAEQIQRISRNASGGTYVLCTSFLICRALYEKLPSEIKLRVVLHEPGKTMGHMIERFKRNWLGNMRPIILCCGSMWQSVDIRTDSDTERFMDSPIISDLIVANLPLMSNRSRTHRRRAACLGFKKIEGAQTAIVLRQGIGRLVRSPSDYPRKIWMLDGRLVTSTENEQYRIIRNVVDAYPQIEF